VEVRVQGLNLTVEALYGCAGFGGGEKNLLTINVVSGHARRIGTPGPSQSSRHQMAENLGTRLAGDKRQRHLDGGAASRCIDH
jgi:hypothetical protein